MSCMNGTLQIDRIITIIIINKWMQMPTCHLLDSIPTALPTWSHVNHVPLHNVQRELHESQTYILCDNKSSYWIHVITTW